MDAGHAEVGHVHDIDVAEAAGGFRLPFEPLNEFAVPCQSRHDDLERDRARGSQVVA
jgi:hypothetical protein